MKKIYTIGREEGCDIVIQDDSDVVSRLHATIRVESENKIYITDQSRNGTYVNGMRISSNVEVPVSRKDVISLAHVTDFDWSMIPKRRFRFKLKTIVVFVFFFLIAFLAALFSYKYFFNNDVTTRLDSVPEQCVAVNRQDSIKQEPIVVENAVKSSSRKHVKSQAPRKEKEVEKAVEMIPAKSVETSEEVCNPIY